MIFNVTRPAKADDDATKEKDVKAKTVDEAREIVRDYTQKILREKLQKMIRPSIHVAVSKSMFDTTHMSVWHPVRMATRDKSCGVFSENIRKYLVKNYKDEVINKDFQKKYSKKINS